MTFQVMINNLRKSQVRALEAIGMSTPLSKGSWNVTRMSQNALTCDFLRHSNTFQRLSKTFQAPAPPTK